MFLKFDILSLIKRGIKFNDNIVIKDSFFERLKSLSLIDFRNNINNVQKYNNPLIIDEKVEKYYDNI